MRIFASVERFANFNGELVAYASYVSDDSKISSSVEVNLKSVVSVADVEVAVSQAVLDDANSKIGKGALTSLDVILR